MTKSKKTTATVVTESKKVVAEQNPNFVIMINPKGFEVEIHKDRVVELSTKGYKLA